MRMPVEVLIISAGSECVSAFLAGVVYKLGFSYAVLSLVPHSILRGANGCVGFYDLSSDLTNFDGLKSKFIKLVESIKLSSEPLVIFPSDDGSLRLLNECRNDILEWAEYSRARNLPMGGVDKAEVHEYLVEKKLCHLAAPAMVMTSPLDTLNCFSELGEDLIFKPALKPIAMDLSPIGSRNEKIISKMHNETLKSFIRRLEKAWPISDRWVAQPRLMVGRGLERSVCAVNGINFQACQVVEQLKFPSMGGTAFWVAIQHETDLIPSAKELMNALNIVGISELSYLRRGGNENLMIEFNPRPWLQISLPQNAGFDIVGSTINALKNQKNYNQLQPLKMLDWIQPERVIQACLAGEISLSDGLAVLKMLMSGQVIIGGYESNIPISRVKRFLKSCRKAGLVKIH